MKLLWAEAAWEDHMHWQANSQDMLKKINELIRDTRRDPFRGLGKPEPLKGPLRGWWSRRITGDHRLVYRISGNGDAQFLEIAQCRYHY